LKASLFHQVQVIDVYYLLKSEELLAKFAMKRVQDHLQNVFLALILSKPVLVPYLIHEMSKNFPLQVCQFLSNIEGFDDRVHSAAFDYCMYQFGTPYVLISEHIRFVIQPE
jgi:hypothetical protein